MKSHYFLQLSIILLLSDATGQIQAGDILEIVDGKSIDGLPSSVITAAVRGRPKSTVTLGLRRDDITFSLDVLRDFNRANVFDNQPWEKAFGSGRKPSGHRTFLVL